MGRVIYGIYIGFFVLTLISSLFSKETDIIQSATNILSTYSFFEVCIATLLYGILLELEKKNRMNL